MWIVEAMRLGRLSLALLIVTDIASAGTTMESIGAEKCGGRVSAFKVEFLAPESAPLEATAKAIVRGAPDPGQDAVTLSSKLAATTKLRRFEELCVVVARP